MSLGSIFVVFKRDVRVRVRVGPETQKGIIKAACLLSPWRSTLRLTSVTCWLMSPPKALRYLSFSSRIVSCSFGKECSNTACCFFGLFSAVSAQVDLDNLPSYDEIFSILSGEAQPLNVFLEFALIYYSRGDIEGFTHLLTQALSPDFYEHLSNLNPTYCASPDFKKHKIDLRNALASARTRKFDFSLQNYSFLCCMPCLHVG